MPKGWGIIQPPKTTTTPPKRKRRRQTLRRIYRRVIVPQLEAQDSKKSTFQAYETHLRGWERYWAERRAKREAAKASVPPIDPSNSQGKKRVCDPPIDRISKGHLEAFRRWLLPGRSTLTVNNYLRTLSTILSAGLDSGAIDRAPKIRRLKARKAARKIVLSYEHVDCIYRACEVAKWPNRDQSRERLLDPVAQWRAAIVMFFVFGFRTQELIRYQSWKRSLSWQNLTASSLSPGLSEAVNAHGWLTYVPQKQEGAKPEPLYLALPELVALHLRSIRPTECVAGSLFPWPLSEEKFRSTWRSILIAAGVRPKFESGADRYLLKHFRKTATTWHNYHEPGIAPHIIGHADRSVSDAHYNNPELATTRALQKFPMPESFNAIRKTDQMELF